MANACASTPAVMCWYRTSSAKHLGLARRATSDTMLDLIHTRCKRCATTLNTDFTSTADEQTITQISILLEQTGNYVQSGATERMRITPAVTCWWGLLVISVNGRQ
jgi:hypothetical protein